MENELTREGRLIGRATAEFIAAEEAAYQRLVARQIAEIRANETAEEREIRAAYERILYA